MKKILNTLFKYIVFLGLGIYIIYHMIHELSPAQEEQLVNSLKSVNWYFLLPVFALGFLSHFFRVLRWQLLLHTIDVKPTIINTCFAVFIGYFVNLGIPRAGEVAKCTVLAKYEKVPPHKLVGTIVAERAFDVLCLIITWLIAFALQASVISGYVSKQYIQFKSAIKHNESSLLIIIVVSIVLVISLILIYRRHKENKIGIFLKEMSHGVSSIFRMKNRMGFIVLTILIWVMYIFQIYIGFWGLPGLGIYHLTIPAAIVVLVYGALGMIVTPGGIGLYTLLVAQILAAYQVDDINAQAFGWIAWAVQEGIIVILGILSFIFIHSYNKWLNGKVALDTK